MFALLTDSAFARKSHSAINCSMDGQIFSWCLFELPLKKRAQAGVGYCNASGAPRSKTKKTDCLPPAPQEQPCVPWSNLSAITKKKSKH